MDPDDPLRFDAPDVNRLLSQAERAGRRTLIGFAAALAARGGGPATKAERLELARAFAATTAAADLLGRYRAVRLAERHRAADTFALDDGREWFALLSGLEAAPPNWSGAGQHETEWERFRREQEAERLKKEAEARTRQEAERAAKWSAEQRAKAEAEERRRNDPTDPFRVFEGMFGGRGGKFTWGFYDSWGPAGGTYYTPPPPKPPPPPPPPPSWAEVLGVPANADVTAIKAAYKRLALEHHPSRGGDTARMQAVNAAYDQAKRERGFQ